MKGLQLLKILNRLALIFAVLSFLLGNINHGEIMVYTYIWQSVISYLVFKCKDKKIAYLISLFIIIPVIKMPDTTLIVFTVITGVYAVYFAIREVDKLSYNNTCQEFEKGLIILGVVSLLSLILINVGILGKTSGHYMIIYLLSSVILLRLLRNADYTKGNKSVEKINFIYSCVLIACTIILSVPYVNKRLFGFLKAAYILITDTIFKLLYGFIIIVAHIGERVYEYLRELMLKLPQDGTTGEIKTSGESVSVTVEENKLLQAILNNAVLSTLLRVIVIALIVYIVARILKKFSKKNNIIKDEYIETKEYIGVDHISINKIFKRVIQYIKPSGSYEKIRLYYKKFIKSCIHKGVDIENSDTTLDIMNKTRYSYDKRALEDMRNIYINIRYGNLCANNELFKRFIIAYRKTKNK